MNLDFEAHPQVSSILAFIMFVCQFEVKHKMECGIDKLTRSLRGNRQYHFGKLSVEFIIQN